MSQRLHYNKSERLSFAPCILTRLNTSLTTLSGSNPRPFFLIKQLLLSICLYRNTAHFFRRHCERARTPYGKIGPLADQN